MEKTFENRLIMALRKAGAYAHHVEMMGEAGFPDILAIKNGKAIGIECKEWKKQTIVKQLFQPTQLPFYVRYNEVFPIFVAVKAEDSILFFKADETQIDTSSKLFSFFHAMKARTMTIKEIVDELNTEIWSK